MACIFLHLPKLFCFSLTNLLMVTTRLTATRRGSIHPVQFACALKGGALSIATQELLLALQLSAPGLDNGIATWHTSGG